jgi:signal transduction histidine kinase
MIERMCETVGRWMPAHRRRTLVVGLASIAAIFLAQAIVSTRWTAGANAEARRLADESITSVDLVTRIVHDIDQQRILVDAHIPERSPARMAQIEEHIARIDADLQRAAEAYGPLADEQDELGAWNRALAAMRHFRDAIQRALDLSRKNLDDAARAAMTNVKTDYPDLERAVGDLVEINRASVRMASARQAELEASAAAAVLATQLAGLVGLVFVGWWGFRRIAHEEHQASEVRTLEQRNEELDAFAGRVAHDLRNPLSTIAFTTELLARADRQGTPPLIERLRRGSRRIDALIADLLALSRSGAASNGARCNPSSVIANVRESFDERFGTEATLQVDVAAADVPYGETLLQQAIWNLVENGVKYRRPDVAPEVRISGRVTQDTYVICVEDNGIGMTPDEVRRVFEPFYRAGRSSAIGGTGLGLAIVKRVVEAHGGTVAVESRLDHGSTFVLSLPLATAR